MDARSWIFHIHSWILMLPASRIIIHHTNIEHVSFRWLNLFYAAASACHKLSLLILLLCSQGFSALTLPTLPSRFARQIILIRRFFPPASRFCFPNTGLSKFEVQCFGRMHRGTWLFLVAHLFHQDKKRYVGRGRPFSTYIRKLSLDLSPLFSVRIWD